MKEAAQSIFSSSVNQIYQSKSELNEVYCDRYNNNYNRGGYRGNNYNKGKKDWSKDNKGSYQKQDNKKDSKDKDVYLTLTKDIKFCCPAGFDENIFACACRIIQEKVNNARLSGVTDIKTVNAVEKDNFMCVFNFPENVYDGAWAQATGEEELGSPSNPTD